MSTLRAIASTAVLLSAALVVSGCSPSSSSSTQNSDISVRSSTLCVTSTQANEPLIGQAYADAAKKKEKTGSFRVHELITGSTTADALAKAANAECGVIITPTPDMALDARRAAAQHRDIAYVIVDTRIRDTNAKNVIPATSGMDEAAFVAGYAAAGTTRTGTVGVMTQNSRWDLFAAGFASGVDFYNQANGTGISVAGWDWKKEKAVSASSTQKVQEVTGNLMNQGADIIAPLTSAGTHGIFDAVSPQGGQTVVIWPGVDAYELFPDQRPFIMTSLILDPGSMISSLTKNLAKKTVPSSPLKSTLKNKGIRVGDYHEFGVRITPTLSDELSSVTRQVIEGKIEVHS